MSKNPFPLDKQGLLEAYRTMRTIREFEERVHSEFAKGDIPGFVHLYAGEEASGVGVCFTGVAVDAQGSEIPRDTLAEHARRLGLVVEDSFTKSRCGLLVAADPASQSGKAGKARSWGIPIIGAADFLAATPGGSIKSRVVGVGGRQAVEWRMSRLLLKSPRVVVTQARFCNDQACPDRSPDSTLTW